MSLSEVNVWRNVWQQIGWKLKAYHVAFLIIVVVQAIFGYFAMKMPSTVSTMGGSYVQILLEQFSIESILYISLMALFSLVLVMTNKASIHENNSVVTSRLTGALSTIGYAIILSVVATMTLVSTFYMMLFVLAQTTNTLWFTIELLPMRTIVVCLALHICAGAAGLACGTLFIKSRFLLVFVVIVGAFIAPYAIYNVVIISEEMSINYYAASGFILLISLLLYAGMIWLRQRQEVLR